MNERIARHDRGESAFDLLRHDSFDIPELAALLRMDCRRIEQAVYHGELAARTVNHRIVEVDRLAVIAWLGRDAVPEPPPGA